MHNQSERLLRLVEVTQRTGLSKSSIYRLEAAKQFPSRVRLSARAVAYRESSIANWIAERALCSAESSAA